MNHGVIMTGSGKKNNFMWPSIARLADGRLIVVSSGFRLQHVCPFGCVAAALSSDDGKTWSEPFVLFDTPLDDRDAGVTPWKDGFILTTSNNTKYFQRKCMKDWGCDDATARVIAEALDAVSDEEEHAYLGSLYAVFGKNCELLRWGKLPVTSPHGFTLLNDGTLFYLGRLYGHEDVTGIPGSAEDKIGFVTSSDGARFSEPVWLTLPERESKAGYLFCEPHAVQLQSGRILAQVRVQKEGVFTIYQCISDDNGKTFGPMQPLAVPEGAFNGSPPHLLETAEGEVVLVYGRRIPPYGQRARISRDGGESWSEEVVLRGDGKSWDLGYPASVQCADGTILTVYYQRLKKAGNQAIQYTKWKTGR